MKNNGFTKQNNGFWSPGQPETFYEPYGGGLPPPHTHPTFRVGFQSPYFSAVDKESHGPIINREAGKNGPRPGVP